MGKRVIYDLVGHAHFVTFSCYKRRRLLDDDRAKRIVVDVLASELARHRADCFGYVVMPHHVHAIVRFPSEGHLGAFMKQWKQRSSVQLGKLLRGKLVHYSEKVSPREPRWQRHYYAFNITTREKLLEKLSYMHNNPVNAGLVEKPYDWEFCSARFYEEGKPVGIPICRIS